MQRQERRNAGASLIRAFDSQSASGPLERFGHVHHAGFKIDVLPLECEQFTATRSGCETEKNERVKPGASRGFEKLLRAFSLRPSAAFS